MIVIPEKCYTCHKRIGYMITNTDRILVKEYIISHGLFQQCEECFVKGEIVLHY